jgi:NAD binding domain of 6-phosphogluconate dehydrogenase
MTRTGNTVAVIGLGVMGAPMAANLIRAGYDVVGFNRSPGKVETHAARGGRRASSIAKAVEGPTSCGRSCTCSSRRCHAVGRRERQPCRRAGLAPRPQRNPGTPTPREALWRDAYLPEQRPLSA